MAVGVSLHPPPPHTHSERRGSVLKTYKNTEKLVELPNIKKKTLIDELNNGAHWNSERGAFGKFRDCLNFAPKFRYDWHHRFLWNFLNTCFCRFFFFYEILYLVKHVFVKYVRRVWWFSEEKSHFGNVFDKMLSDTLKLSIAFLVFNSSWNR